MKQLGIFLKRKHVNKGETPTHVRIANKSLNIPGGAYNIDYSNETEFNEFVESYVNTVIKKNRNEYLTEVQDRKNGGPILVDLDFKMPKDNTERLFDKEIIDDIVQTYAETINEKFDLSKIEEYSIFVLLKDDINEENTDYNKDGIHIQFSFGAKHREQMYLRSIVMKKVENEVFTSMDFENNIDDIFDKSISSGSTGWLIYGSCKPGGEPYKLKYKYNVKIFEDDYELNDCSIKKIRSKEIFKELLIRKKNIDMITLKDEYKSELDKFTNNGYKKTSDKIVIKNTVISSCFIKSSFKNIYSEEICDNMIQLILENSIINNSKIREINRYLMKCLDERYYEPYADWIRVLWACKNTDEQLYPFFLKWSSQSEKFSWNDTENIDYIYNLWEKSRNTGLKEASIRYWAIKCNSEQYDKIRNESIDKYVIKTLEGNGTDHDIAKLIHFMMYDKYRCTSIKTNTWFSFDNHKWSTCECGTKLRRTFSSIISPLYLQKQKQILGRIRVENDMTTETQNLLASQAAVYNKISIRLRETSKKNNIMQESKELHYDSQLESKLNENPNLLCFNNGVYDFDQGCFRDGIPEDYISKCTNIDYVEIDDTNEEQKEIINEIKDFMKKLFPNENLRKYMWQHLASCLLGSNSNQTFNIYTGVGSNGKSVLVQIMALILGDYKGTVPISLITQKR